MLYIQFPSIIRNLLINHYVIGWISPVPLKKDLMLTKFVLKISVNFWTIWSLCFSKEQNSKQSSVGNLWQWPGGTYPIDSAHSDAFLWISWKMTSDESVYGWVGAVHTFTAPYYRGKVTLLSKTCMVKPNFSFISTENSCTLTSKDQVNLQKTPS